MVNARRESKHEADVSQKTMCVVREGWATGIDKHGTQTLSLSQDCEHLVVIGIVTQSPCSSSTKNILDSQFIEL